jgi:tetratricopeptide (TPR) repeat protein
LHEAGKRCLDAGDWRGLIDLYRKSVGLSRELGDYWERYRAQLLEMLKRTDDPEARSALLTEMGDVYRERMEVNKLATEAYVLAFRQDPENVEALRKARAIYAEEDDHAKLMELLELEHGVADSPEQKAQLLKEMGRILLLDLRNSRAAQQRLELARRHNPGDPELTALLGLARGEYEDVASAYQAAGLEPPERAPSPRGRDEAQAARPARQVARRQRAERPQRPAQALTATTGKAWTPPRAGRTRSANKAVGCIMAVAVLLVGIVGAVVYFVVGEGVGGSGDNRNPPEVAEQLSGSAAVGWEATPDQLETLRVIWASELVDYTTQYDSPSWAADQVLGLPDVYPDSGDRAEAWAPEGTSDTFEWVTVRFSRPVEAIFVVVLETYNPGAVMQVDDMSDPDRPVTLWQGGPVPPLGSSQVFLVQLPSARRISAIRVVLDTSRVPGWNEIDAIGLIPVDQASGRQPRRGPIK